MHSANNPFHFSGSDLFKKAGSEGAIPSAHPDIFTKPKAGGGNGIGGGRSGRAKALESKKTEDDEEELQIEKQATPARAVDPPVKLTNLKWAVDSAHFEQNVEITMDIDIPKSLENITRVIVTVYALGANGKRETIKAKELWAKDGRVQGDFVLYPPSKHEERSAASYPYIYTAKHRDSKEMESPKLQVTGKVSGNEELVLELASTKELKNSGYSFQLKSKDGSFLSKLETKNAEEKAGNIIIKFEKLDPKSHYYLELLDAHGKIIETLFSDVPFGEWDEAAT